MIRRMKLVIYSPVASTPKILETLGNAQAGHIGKYAQCTFTLRGTGRFLPLAGANPAIGEVGKLEEVIEDRIETVCELDQVKNVIAAVKLVHPYEEPAIDVYPIEIIE